MSGPLLFARFAFPPNALGYCGPDATPDLLEYAHERMDDGGLRELAQGFEGAWPYLELIAHANGLADPLDHRVVEAYWLGNDLLEGVRAYSLGRSLDDRFRRVAGSDWSRLAEAVEHDARPHHNFHVFCVYPWVGMLRTGSTADAMHVLDRCRVRGARLVRLDGDTAIAEYAPLTWDGHRLALGTTQQETVVIAADGRSLAGEVAVGDLVACHWDWVCHPLTVGQSRRLRRETVRQLRLVNSGLATPPPAVVVG